MDALVPPNRHHPTAKREQLSHEGGATWPVGSLHRHSPGRRVSQIPDRQQAAHFARVVGGNPLYAARIPAPGAAERPGDRGASLAERDLVKFPCYRSGTATLRRRNGASKTKSRAATKTYDRSSADARDSRTGNLETRNRELGVSEQRTNRRPNRDQPAMPNRLRWAVQDVGIRPCSSRSSVMSAGCRPSRMRF